MFIIRVDLRVAGKILISGLLGNNFILVWLYYTHVHVRVSEWKRSWY